MNTTNVKYYSVIAKCGHVGRKSYVPIKFAVCAENGKEAAKKVRDFPRVKHHNKYAILEVKEIDVVDYKEILEINNRDYYLKCDCKQQQSMIPNFEERICKELVEDNKKINKIKRKQRIEFLLKKRKIYEHNYYEEGDYDYAY